MRDTELYRYLLGIEQPWAVEEVKLDLARPESRCVWAGHKDDVRWPCPECGALMPTYDRCP